MSNKIMKILVRNQFCNFINGYGIFDIQYVRVLTSIVHVIPLELLLVCTSMLVNFTYKFYMHCILVVFIWFWIPAFIFCYMTLLDVRLQVI